jgi:hypothetical protein
LDAFFAKFLIMATSFLGRNDLHIGLRNNNPGNLRPPSGLPWEGQTGTNGGFAVFKDLTYGIRALAIDLGNAIKEGYGTITDLITHYAPPNENNTQAYINAVSDYTGLAPDDPIPADLDTLKSLVLAIADHENGSKEAALIPDQDVNDGLRLIHENLLQYFVSGNALDTAAQAATQNPGTGAALVLLLAVGLFWLFKN